MVGLDGYAAGPMEVLHVLTEHCLGLALEDTALVEEDVAGVEDGGGRAGDWATLAQEVAKLASLGSTAVDKEARDGVQKCRLRDLVACEYRARILTWSVSQVSKTATQPSSSPSSVNPPV